LAGFWAVSPRLNNLSKVRRLAACLALAGLALFRYQSRCGTVYRHTGNFPGYVQFAAATADGKRAVTTTLNIPAPTDKLLARLRSVQVTAVCALLGK
jgi:D-alanyl-D-alanine carboxypeptidase